MGSAMTSDAVIREQAVHWLLELNEAGAKERAECVAWLRASPHHVREFLFVSALCKGLDDIDSQRRVNVDELLAEASAKVVSLPSEPAMTFPIVRKPPLRNWIAGVAAAMLAVVSISAWWLMARAPVYSTAIGEQRSLKLQDGSLVNLNTHSRLSVRLTGKARDIQLLEGEALFTVARDPARPFRVHSGETVIQALGTQFNVYRRGQSTTVAVLEGAVKVFEHSHETARLAAGEQVSLAPQGILKREKLDASKAVSWRERRLVFHGDSLAQVAAEVNRYNETLQIRVDSSARERRLIGVFAADDPESLIQFLSRDDSLIVSREGNSITIRAR